MKHRMVPGVLLLLALVLAPAVRASAQTNTDPRSMGLHTGGKALGVDGWSLALHGGFGSDFNNGVGLNPFGDGFGPYGFGGGFNASFASSRYPIFIAAEGNLYLGEKVSGIRGQLGMGTGWLGYNGVLGRRFVLRPGIGGGIDALRITGSGNNDISFGLVGGVELRGMLFVSDHFFFDALGRVTVELTQHDGTRYNGISIFGGIGYAFGSRASVD